MDAMGDRPGDDGEVVAAEIEVVAVEMDEHVLNADGAEEEDGKGDHVRSAIPSGTSVLAAVPNSIGIRVGGPQD